MRDVLHGTRRRARVSAAGCPLRDEAAAAATTRARRGGARLASALQLVLFFVAHVHPLAFFVAVALLQLRGAQGEGAAARDSASATLAAAASA